MDEAERSVLRTALRMRPSTVEKLARATELPEDRVRELVDGNEWSRVILREGKRLRYARPDRTIAEQLVTLLEQRQRRLADESAELQDLLAELPELVTDWFSGADEHALQIEVLHGADSGTELWRRQLRNGIPTHARAVLPDLHRFLKPGEQQNRFIRSMSVEGRSARAIISTEDGAIPEIAAQLPVFRDAGLEIRMHPEPPSWFWVHDDRTAAIPLTWGEAWPASVMAVYSQPFAGALGALFDRLWRESVPADSAAEGWNDLLRLMRSGLTLDAASRTLGIAPRTGRRRVAAAMDHYGAQTLFGLGVAWAEAEGVASEPGHRAL